MWTKPNYEEAVRLCNLALMMDEATCQINGTEYETENAKYMLAVFGSQFGYTTTLKNNYINLKKQSNDSPKR